MVKILWYCICIVFSIPQERYISITVCRQKGQKEKKRTSSTRFFWISVLSTIGCSTTWYLIIQKISEIIYLSVGDWREYDWYIGEVSVSVVILSCHGATLYSQPQWLLSVFSSDSSQLSAPVMYHLIPDHLGFLLKREESLFEGNSSLGSQCAALARHTVYQEPKTGAAKG